MRGQIRGSLLEAEPSPSAVRKSREQLALLWPCNAEVPATRLLRVRPGRLSWHITTSLEKGSLESCLGFV
jgi:hypothetical protein